MELVGYEIKGAASTVYGMAEGAVGAVADPLGTITALYDACAQGIAQYDGDMPAGIAMCVDNLNPIAQIRDQLYTTVALVEAGCGEEAAEMFGSALTGITALAAPFAKAGAATGTLATTAVRGIPEESLAVIKSIREDGVIVQSGVQGPSVPGSFANDGRNGGHLLPSTDASGHVITYREWGTVPSAGNPKPGGERIVTGSDGSIYYSPDHYQTFIRWGP